jgi:DNA-binding transcriptional LysR family regulator
MDRFQAMQIFVRVAEAGGFAEASRQLHLSAPTVTRAIARLEHLTGARLFVRTTRTVKLTEAGARYVEDCRRILADLAEADAAASGAYRTPNGLLTVTAPVQFGQLLVMPILLDYLDRHPEVSGRLLFLDRLVNVVEEGFDLAVRIGHLADSRLSAIRVGSVRRAICGSPDYLERHGRPTEPTDLLDHRIIAAGSNMETIDWRFGTSEEQTIRLRPSLHCNSNEGVARAAVAGWGLTRLPCYQVAGAVAEGRLEHVLVAHEEDPLPVHIIHPEGRRASAKVRAFIDLAVDRLRAASDLH